MSTTAPLETTAGRFGRKVRIEKVFLYCGDLFLAAAALCFAFILRIGLDHTLSQSETLQTGLLLFIPVCAAAFPFAGLYNRRWRYASLGDLMVIPKAIVLASLIFVLVMFVFTRLDLFPRSVVVIQAFILMFFMGGARLIFRIDEVHRLALAIMGTRTNKEEVRVPVLLVGAGNAGDLYLRALARDPNATYDPVGILDDDPQNENLNLRGVPVVGKTCDLDAVLVKLQARGCRPHRIIFTENNTRAGLDESQKLIKQANALGIAVSRVPSPTELRDPTKESEVELRPIQLTDLLERPQTALDRERVADLISGQRIVVTGAGGSIGKELVTQIADLNPAEIVLIDNSEFNLYSIDRELMERFPDVVRFCYMCDIRAAHRVDEIFDRHGPEIVFNAAALKHVPMVEMNPCEGVLTNVVGTRNVAEAAKRCNVLAFVQISTDKAVDSTSVMGATKRIAELYCQALDLERSGNSRTRFMTVRFGNVLGSSGSLIPLFQRQLSRGGPLTVTDPKMTRFFMTIREAVELTLQSSSYGIADQIGQGEIFVLDMGEPVKIMDIATRMIRLAGLTPGKDIEVKIVGCRPGEKLFEELFDEAEQRVELNIPGVFGALPKPLELEFLRDRIAQLKYLARTGDEKELFAVMREIMPRYRPEKPVRTPVAANDIHRPVRVNGSIRKVPMPTPSAEQSQPASASSGGLNITPI